MKLIYGGVPYNTTKVRHFEVSTNDATLIPSDLQSGVTAYARGQKVTGTGKSFEFANYGRFFTNFPIYVPSSVNIVEIASTEHPVRISIALSDMKNVDFSNLQEIGYIIIDNTEYPITASVADSMLTIYCEQSIYLQVFYGKDNYI